MDVFCDNESYKIDYKISLTGNLTGYLTSYLTITIQCGILSMSFHINNPKNIGVDKWQHLRDSKTGRPRYDGSRIEQKGYNIMIIFDEDYKIGYYQYIKSEDGILEMGTEYGNENGNRNRKQRTVIKIPIEYAYDILDKIISDLSANENTTENTTENTKENTN